MPTAQALPYGIQRTGDPAADEPRILSDTARTFMSFHHWFLGGRILSKRGLLTTLTVSFVLTCIGVVFGSWLWSADPKWLALYLWRPQTAALFGLAYAFNLAATSQVILDIDNVFMDAFPDTYDRAASVL